MSLRKLKIGQEEVTMSVCGSLIHITHPKHGVWEIQCVGSSLHVATRSKSWKATYSNWYDTNFNVEIWLDILRDIWRGVR